MNAALVSERYALNDLFVFHPSQRYLSPHTLTVATADNTLHRQHLLVLNHFLGNIQYDGPGPNAQYALAKM